MEVGVIFSFFITNHVDQEYTSLLTLLDFILGIQKYQTKIAIGYNGDLKTRVGLFFAQVLAVLLNGDDTWQG